MNANTQTIRTATTIAIACPWCDEPVGVDDAFVTPAIRCPACATVVDLEPAGASATAIAAAA